VAIRDGWGGAVKGTAWLSISPRNWQLSADINLLFWKFPAISFLPQLKEEKSYLITNLKELV